MIMFFKLFNLIKIAILFKKKFIKLKLKKNEISILKILVKYNIIKYFNEKNNEFIIFFKYSNARSILKINSIYKKSNLMYVNYNVLNRITKKCKGVYIISTNEGVMSNYECTNRKKGGVLLAYINIFSSN